LGSKKREEKKKKKKLEKTLKGKGFKKKRAKKDPRAQRDLSLFLTPLKKEMEK